MTQETTSRKIETPKDLVLAALTHARNIAAREVRIAEGVVSVLDYQGNLLPAVPVEAPASIRYEDVRDALHSRKGGYYHLDPNWDVETTLKDLGNWSVVSDSQTGLTLRPRKAPSPCLEGVAEVDAESVARLRSLYAQGGFNVIVMCEGEPRTRELATALMAERRQIGLPTNLTLLASENRHGWRNQPKSRDYQGFFQPVATAEGAPWSIRQVEYKDAHGHINMAFDGDETRVFVMSLKRYGLTAERMAADMEKRKSPSACIHVSLKDSKPVMRVAFTSSLLPRTSTETGFKDAPWDIYNERKEARLKSRPPAPKTWHQTTEAVARAFVRREAPRGYVSSRSIYFHGPVAYSISDRNPIAAIVDNPKGGKPFLFMGRQPGIYGGQAGTVSSAQGDISQAAGDDFHILDVGDLTRFVRLRDLGLNDLAASFRGSKNETEFPSTCRINRDGLSYWIEERAEHLRGEIERMSKTKFATFNRSQVYRAMAGLADFRDIVAESFGMWLPSVGDAKSFRQMAQEEKAAARKRQEGFKEKRDAFDAETFPKGEEASAFGMR